MDRNGYNESLLPTGGKCWYCGCTGALARHEAFEGAGRRKKCKRLGFWVTVCPVCHGIIHEHPRSGVALLLKQNMEKTALMQYDWTIHRFIDEIGENYL